MRKGLHFDLPEPQNVRERHRRGPGRAAQLLTGAGVSGFPAAGTPRALSQWRCSSPLRGTFARINGAPQLGRPRSSWEQLCRAQPSCPAKQGARRGWHSCDRGTSVSIEGSLLGAFGSHATSMSRSDGAMSVCLTSHTVQAHAGKR